MRPRIKRRDFTSLVARLNELEKQPAGSWKLDASEMTSAVKFSDQSGKLGRSSLGPDTVAAEVRAALVPSQATATLNLTV